MRLGQSERDLRVLEHFALSLPDVPYRRLTVAFLLAVLLVAYGLSSAVFDSESDARGIAHALDGVLTLDPNAATDAVRSFELEGALGAAFTLALALLVVAAPVAGSFRLLRIPLNRYPAGRAGARPRVGRGARRRIDGRLRPRGARIRSRGGAAAARAAARPSRPRACAVAADLVRARARCSRRARDRRRRPARLGVRRRGRCAPRGHLRRASPRPAAPRDSGASPIATAAPRRRTHPLRVAAVAASVLGVAAAAASFATPTVAPDPVFVQISSARLEADVTRGEYLRLIEVPLAGFTHAELAAPGLTVTCEIELRAQPDQPISLRLELYDTRTEARVDATGPAVARLGTLGIDGDRAEVDPKKIVLLRLSGVRRSARRRRHEQWTFWIVRPPRNGRYFATVRASLGQPCDRDRDPAVRGRVLAERRHRWNDESRVHARLSRKKKRMMGLEPTTFCMASRRSSQLSYIRVGRKYSGGQPAASASSASFTSWSASLLCSRRTAV